MNSRKFAPACYNAVKTAFKNLISDLGGIDAAASCTRIGRSQIANYGMAGNEQFVPVDVLMDLEHVGGFPHVTAALARTQGFVLVPVECSRNQGELSVLLATIGKDVGDLFATGAAVLAHGKPTDVEREVLLREFDEIRRVSSESIAFLKQTAGAL